MVDQDHKSCYWTQHFCFAGKFDPITDFLEMDPYERNSLGDQQRFVDPCDARHFLAWVADRVSVNIYD